MTEPTESTLHLEDPTTQPGQSAIPEQSQNLGPTSALDDPRDPQQEAEDSFSDHTVYCYQTDWDIYALGFSNNSNYPFRVAMGSLCDHNKSNRIDVVQLNKDNVSFEKKFTIHHDFPATKVMWIPDKDSSHPDILASTSDCLRIWTIKDNQEAILSHTLKNVSIPLFGLKS